MIDYQSALAAVIGDPHYQKNLDWGQPRPGHSEGTIRAHIAELEGNLESLRPKLSETEYWKLKLLIHVHDTFKPEAVEGIAIADPRSHASLARQFLARYSDDADLLAMVQFHDEPFALWRQFKSRGRYNEQRWTALQNNIHDWNLFLAFAIIDGSTTGKSREPLEWLFQKVSGQVESRLTAADIL